MAQSGWRLPDELLKRVRVRCAEEGVRQNAWVERALEAALKVPELESLGPNPSPALVKAAARERQARGEWTAAEIVESIEAPPVAQVKAEPKSARAQPLGKGFVPPRPKGK